MPQVLEQNGFRVMIYPDDHRPAHVHVYKSGLIVIRLNNRRTPPCAAVGHRAQEDVGKRMEEDSCPSYQ
jgi:hypothetical protein